MPPHSGDAVITFSFLALAINLGSVWSPLILYILHETLITNQNYSYLKWRHVQSRPHYKRLMILDTRILCITESKYYHQLYSQNRNDYLPTNGNNQRRSSRPPNPPIGGGPRPTLGAQVSLKLLFGYVTIFSSADLFTTDLNCRKKLACDIISECNVILSRRI